MQEAFLEARKRLPELAQKRELPVLLWLRLVTGQKLIDLHRTHLGAKMRDAGLEVSLYRGALPEASSMLLAGQLLGKLTTASHAAVRIVFSSNEYHESQVDAYFEQFLDRPADPNALAFFSDELNKGGTDQLVISQLIDSDEYYEKAQQ